MLQTVPREQISVGTRPGISSRRLLDHCVTNDADAPSCPLRAQTEFGLFEVEKEPLVEQADFAEHLAPNEHRGAIDPIAFEKIITRSLRWVEPMGRRPVGGVNSAEGERSLGFTPPKRRPEDAEARMRFCNSEHSRDAPFA
jgi:hypothetical protein